MRGDSILPVLAMAAAFLPSLGGCSSATGDEGGADALSTPRYTATMVGRIDSEEEARSLVANAAGVIDRVAVARGETVRRGQLLFSVDCRAMVATIAVRQAEAAQADAAADTVEAGARAEDVAKAEAALEQAQSGAADALDQLDRAAALVENGFVSAREMTARRNALAAAQARVAGVEAELALLRNGARPSERADARWRAKAASASIAAARATSDRCAVFSPIDGTVLQILRNVGEDSGIGQAQPVMVVGDLNRLIVRAEVNERDAVRIRSGQAVDVWIDGDRRRWSGRVVGMASVMGRRQARSLDPSDRFDRDMREAFIRVDDSSLPGLVGLRVMVGMRP